MSEKRGSLQRLLEGQIHGAVSALHREVGSSRWRSEGQACRAWRSRRQVRRASEEK